MNLSDIQLTDDHLGDIIKRLKTLPRPFDAAENISPNAETSRTFHNKATPIQGESYMISQGCYGTSNDAAIGTQHVGNCIALILRNPQTNLTSLVHFDAHTSAESLDKIFKNFEGQPTEAAIIGAKYAETDDPNYKGYYQETSRSNLLTILNLLAAKDTKLTSAWVSDSDQPHAFLIDPKSGQMQVGEPTIPDPEQNILFATRYFSAGPHDIALSYDLTTSKQRAFMPLNAETTNFLDEFGEASNTKTNEDLKQWITSKGKNPDDLDFFDGMFTHYQKSQSTPLSLAGAKSEQVAAIVPYPN